MDYTKLLKEYTKEFVPLPTEHAKDDEMKAYNRVQMPTIFKPYFAKYSYEKWLPREGDVLIAAYPKCGTNWCINIIMQLMFNEEKMELFKQTPALSVLEAGPEKKYELLDQVPSPRLLMTHQPHFNVNIERYLKQKLKIVVIYRNPKDVAVSFYHFHLKAYPSEFRVDTWNKYVKLFMRGGLPKSFCRPGETYLDHFLGWYKLRNNEQILLMCYEEMKLNPEKEIQKLSNFLGLKKSDKEITRVAEVTSFSSMKKQQDSDFNILDRQRKNTNMIRKGIIGDWRNHFTVAQSEEMDALVAEKAQGIDFKFTSKL